MHHKIKILLCLCLACGIYNQQTQALTDKDAQTVSTIIGLITGGTAAYIVFNEMQRNDASEKLTHQNKKMTIDLNDENTFIVDAKELAKASDSQDIFLKNLIVSLLCGSIVGVITKVGSEWILTTQPDYKSDYKPYQEKQGIPKTESPIYTKPKKESPEERPEDQKDDLFKPWKETAQGKKCQKEWDELIKKRKDLEKEIPEPIKIGTFHGNTSNDWREKYRQQKLMDQIDDIWRKQRLQDFDTQSKKQPYEKTFSQFLHTKHDLDSESFGDLYRNNTFKGLKK